MCYQIHIVVIAAVDEGITGDLSSQILYLFMFYRNAIGKVKSTERHPKTSKYTCKSKFIILTNLRIFVPH